MMAPKTEGGTEQFRLEALLRELGTQLSTAIVNAGKTLSKDREEERHKIVKEVLKFGKQRGIHSRVIFSMGKALISRPDDVRVFVAVEEEEDRMAWLQIFYDDHFGDNDREEERHKIVMKEVLKFGKPRGIRPRVIFSMGRALISRPDDVREFFAVEEVDRMAWLQIFYEDHFRDNDY